LSIRLIAKDLYRLQQEVEKLEQQIKSSDVDKREALKDRLRKLTAKRNRMRKILNGEIDRSSQKSFQRH
jgi:hypothetical protein